MRLRHEAARHGWELYSGSLPHLTRDEINCELERVGLPTIAERTYDHYGRLARHDVSGYMPINEFDVALKTGQLGRRSA